jgi:hypothetical protein
VCIGLQNISSSSSDVDFWSILLQVNELQRDEDSFVHELLGSYYCYLSGQVM